MGGHLQVADESIGGLRVKKAVDIEALLIENEAGTFGSDTLVSAKSSTSAGSSIMGIAYVPAPDVQDRKALSTYQLFANETDAGLDLMNNPGSGSLSETALSGRCEFAFRYHHRDTVNTARMSLGESHNRLTFVGVNDVEFTEPVASPSDLIAYFGIEGQPI